MYASFYNLVEAPFPVTPDPKYLYLSDSHKEALASIVYGVSNRRGFVAITGEVGTGKSTILRAYLDAIEKSKFIIVYVFNPEVTFEELVIIIAEELGISSSNLSTSALVSQIHRVLVKEYENGRDVVLIIDEAQNMPVPTLESIRMLSNIETTSDKLLQIVLVGQPELQELLNRHELRQLNQRIAVKSTINPLSDSESQHYIEERLKAVSLDGKPVFNTAAITRIVKFAGGIPRSINIACDSALINGFGHGTRPITVNIVNEAISSLNQPAKEKRSFWKGGVGLLAAALLMAVIYWKGSELWTDQAELEGQSMATNASAAMPDLIIDSGAPDEQASQPIIEPIASTVDSATSYIQEQKTIVQSVVDADPIEDVSEALHMESLTPVDNAELWASQVEFTPEQLYQAKWGLEDLHEEGFPATRVMKAGDMVSYYCINIYGFASDELFDFLQASNPELASIHTVSTGDRITFPALTEPLQLIRRASIERKIRKYGLPGGSR